MKKTSPNGDFKNTILYELKNNNISKFLFTLRCNYNLTQKDLAKKMNYNQNKISKIEHSCDDDLTIKDLLNYKKVFNFKINIEIK